VAIRVLIVSFFVLGHKGTNGAFVTYMMKIVSSVRVVSSVGRASPF
jgi:hypothetical protein